MSFHVHLLLLSFRFYRVREKMEGVSRRIQMEEIKKKEKRWSWEPEGRVSK